MKINKSDLKDSISFIGVALLFFMVGMDLIFPFIMFMMKVVFYLFGSLMLILGIGTMIRSVLGRRKDAEEKLSESEKK